MRSALATYQQVDRSGLIEGSSPVGIVRTLFGELEQQIVRLSDAPLASAARGDAVSRAIAIVLTLQGSLDFEHGGEVAHNLARIYDWLRRTLLTSLREPNEDNLRSAARIAADFHDAWRRIGSQG